jgi:hypothetical protein
VIEEFVAMSVSSAEALEISDFAHNPWHPDRAPQLRGPV